MASSTEIAKNEAAAKILRGEKRMIRLDTKIEKLNLFRGIASIHIELECGGFTVSNIMIRKTDNDKWTVTFPLIQHYDNKRPVITMQGSIKQTVIEAIETDFKKLITSQETKSFRSRCFDEAAKEVVREQCSLTP